MIPAGRAARLSVSITNGMTVEIRIGIKEVRIGRGADADLLLPDPSVSRRHARVFRLGDRYFLADCGSKNGTFADENRITQLPLEAGQTFRIGPFRIHFLMEEHPLSRGADPPTVATGAGVNPATADAAPPRPEIPSSNTFGMIGNHPLIKGLIGDIRKVAVSDLPILIGGETGSGKELAARGIHESSRRREKPFVVVNCGAISPALIESELFGHEKGAFTGATSQRRGAFEVAHQGTIFLDEIGELPLALQPKLLRALEQKEIKRVGGNEPILVNVRVLAATNRSLREEMTRKNFRDDLYFRISTITLQVPSLRERKEDIPAIARHFLADFTARAGRPPLEIDGSAFEFLRAYDWPGNVRELRNAVQRAAVMAAAGALAPGDFSFLVPTPAGAAITPDASGAEPFTRWEQAEKANILSELARRKWNKTRTAAELGIAKSTLFEKLKKYGIRSPESDR